MRKVLWAYKQGKVRQLLYEPGADVLDVYTMKWKRVITTFIYKFSKFNLDTVTYKVLNLFKNVTKNLGLLCEVCKKLMLFELYYHELNVNKMMEFVLEPESKHKTLKRKNYPPIDSSLDETTFLMTLVLFLKCSPNRQTKLLS